jgi:hypothetical protein
MSTLTARYDRQPADAPPGWAAACNDLAVARGALRTAPPGIARQAAYTQLVLARDLVVETIHSWVAAAVGAAPVERPGRVVVLGDRILFDEGSDIAAVNLAAAIALRVLQLAGIGVVLASGGSTHTVHEVVARFGLLGGIAEYGVLTSFTSVGSESERRAEEQLSRLRTRLHEDPDVVVAPSRLHSVRACRIVEDRTVPIGGPEGRGLLERLRLTDVALRVTPLHTDFFARDAIQAARLCTLLGTIVPARLPLVAIAGSASDEWTLQAAPLVFIPVGVLPSYRPHSGQRVTRAGRLSGEVLWAALWHLLPSTGLHRQAAEMLASMPCPDWFPESLCRRPALGAPRWLYVGSRESMTASSPSPMSRRVR